MHPLCRRYWIACLGLILMPVLAWGQAQVRVVEVWKVNEGLSKPESVVYDVQRHVLYLSNINGQGGDKDGNGYITKLAMDGTILSKMWVSGLHAPKGLAIANSTLYAADIDVLVAIDPDTGKIKARYAAKGAKFLNDVTIDSAGHVYVSDSHTSALYKLSGTDLQVWLQDDDIQQPNGLYATADALIVAAGDRTADQPGNARYLQRVSLSTKAIRPVTDRTPIGSLDAAVPDGNGGYFLTDWSAGTLMYYTPATGPTLLQRFGKGTADLHYVPHTQMLFLPVMMSHELIALRVEGVD